MSKVKVGLSKMNLINFLIENCSCNKEYKKLILQYKTHTKMV